MGNRLLLHVAVVWTMLLLAGRGTDAARVKLQRSSGETSLTAQRLLGKVSPLHAESGPVTSYRAQHLTIEPSDQGYYGFIATMDVFGFSLNTEQETSGSVSLYHIVDNAATSFNVIQIGWEVSPKTYGDSHTHLFAMWTTDGYQKTGCANAKCPGFQPEKGAPIAPGDVIENVTQPMGPRQNITIKIIKFGTMGDWQIYYGRNQDNLTLFGHFSKSLFNGGMANRAGGIQFGGQVSSPATDLAPMGSGYRPMHDVTASASMRNIQFVNQDGLASPMKEDLLTYMSDSHVYAATPIKNGQFYYGGPVQPDRGQGLPHATWFLKGNRWWFITILLGYCLRH